jgi:hypothetical protein
MGLWKTPRLWREVNPYLVGEHFPGFLQEFYGFSGGGGNRTRVRAVTTPVTPDTKPRTHIVTWKRVWKTRGITLAGHLDTLDTAQTRMATPFAGRVDTRMDTIWTLSAARAHGCDGWTA